MKRLKIPAILCAVFSVLFLASCADPYTVEGQVVDKVFEPAYAKQSMIPAGKVIVPLTNQVGDKWYAEIVFTDKNNQQKTFYWGVTKEAYDAYKIGDKTSVNVDDSVANGGYFVIFTLFGFGVVWVLVKLLRWMFRGIGGTEDSRQIQEVVHDKMTVDVVKDKSKSKLFW